MYKNARITRKWIRNKNDEAAIKEGCYFDPAAAEHVCNFFEQCLCHTDGEYAGKPFLLLEWERDLLSRLFGWKQADGRRRFRQCSAWVPSGNGKSELAAGIVLYMLSADGEIAAEIYGAGTALQNAKNVFKVARIMVEMSPLLRPYFEVVPSNNRIIFPATRSFYQVLSGRAPNADGMKVHLGLMDELHEYKNDEMFNVLRLKLGKRRQPIIMTISTAGVFDPESFAWKQWQVACEIDKGIRVQTDFLSVIYASPIEEDWTSEAVWLKSNPSLGKILRLEDFRKDFEEARDVSWKQAAFQRYKLNRWTQATTTWLPDDRILECAGSTDLTPDEETEVEWTAALDMANTNDLAAFVLVGHLPNKKIVLPFFWCNEDQISVRQKRDGANGALYESWEKEGYMTETRGNTIDYATIKADILELCEKYKPTAIAVDRWNTAQMVQELQDEGLPVMWFGQGFKDMSGPTKELERLILAREIVLGEPVNPVLRWMFKNVALETDAAENIKINRKRRKEKVDGVVSLVMSIGVAMKVDGPSVYETSKPFCLAI